MKHNNSGFTLAELMIVIAIIAIVSAIALPNMIGWRERAKLRGAAENLRGDLQWAKIRAIRDHNVVAVVFDTGRYLVRDAAGLTVRSRQLPAGVVINLGASTVVADPDNINHLKVLFESRGRCQDNSLGQPTDGLLVLQDTAGEQRQISVNPLGLIRQE
jgi:prepilin-type N-terminal cleavage/methylation domain-containing protein